MNADGVAGGRARLAATLPAGILGVVFACDLLRDHRVRSRALVGVLDEIAHLATTGLILLSARDVRWLRERHGYVRVALAATVLIDVDHLRPPAGSASVFRGGRSVTHSMTTVAAVLLGTAAAPPVWRRRLVAAASGLALHFGRDVATGHGLMLWWPIRRHAVKVHYGYYAAACLGAAAAAGARLRAHASVGRASVT